MSQRSVADSRFALRRHLAEGKLSRLHQAVLAELDPDWDVNFAEKAWMSSYRRCLQFFGETGRIPRVLRPGNPAEDRERRLGNWIGHQRRGRRLTAERRALLDANLPGWQVSRASSQHWLNSMNACASWILTNGRQPRTHGSKVSAEEKRHGTWLFTQRNGRHISPERAAALDASIPGWRGVIEDRTWDGRRKACAAFLTEHGRLPAVRVADPGEHSLALWVARQRHVELTEAQTKALDSELPGWRGRMSA